VAKNKYTTRKFDGDDAWSWAVFLAESIKGIKGIIFYGEATPIMCSLTRNTARNEASKLNKKAAIK